jgi:hypothetical protein
MSGNAKELMESRPRFWRLDRRSINGLSEGGPCTLSAQRKERDKGALMGLMGPSGSWRGGGPGLR